MGSIFQIILQRLALGILTLLIVSMVIFVAVNALPGDFAQAILGQGATQEAVAQIRADLGLDQNYFMRYFSWLGNVLTGNLGISFAQMNFASNMGGDQLVGVVEQIAP
ncbi:MAG: ABC transporter permease, partial [Planktomarina sp.]|nr:ABC transporter permease [Planktomarina sp.]